MMKLKIEISSKYWARGDFQDEFPHEIEAIIRTLHEKMYQSSTKLDFNHVNFKYEITDTTEKGE